MQGARLFQNGLLRHECSVLVAEEPVRRTLVWPSSIRAVEPGVSALPLVHISLVPTPNQFYPPTRSGKAILPTTSKPPAKRMLAETLTSLDTWDFVKPWQPSRRTAKSRIVAITLRRDERPGVTKACLADLFAPIAFGSPRATRTLQFSSATEPNASRSMRVLEQTEALTDASNLTDRTPPKQATETPPSPAPRSAAPVAPAGPSPATPDPRRDGRTMPRQGSRAGSSDS